MHVLRPSLFRLGDLDHHPHDRPRRIELAPFLAGRVGEVSDQVLVGGTEQVGILEVLVAEPVSGKVNDQVPEAFVGDLRLLAAELLGTEKASDRFGAGHADRDPQVSRGGADLGDLCRHQVFRLV